MQVGLGPTRSLGQGLGKVALKSSKTRAFLKGAEHLQHGASSTKRLICIPLPVCKHPTSAEFPCLAGLNLLFLGWVSCPYLLCFPCCFWGEHGGKQTLVILTPLRPDTVCFLCVVFYRSCSLRAPWLCPLIHRDAFRQAQTPHDGMMWALQVLSHITTSLFRAVIPYY